MVLSRLAPSLEGRHLENRTQATYGLAVIILNWNKSACTMKCLESVISWGAIKPTIYVVDNASIGDGIIDIELRFPYVKIIKSSVNLGFAGGNNLAIRKAVEDGMSHILLLNNDAAIDEDDVLEMLDLMSYRPEIAVIGPRLHEGIAVYAGGRDPGYYRDTRIQWLSRMGTSGAETAGYVPGAVFLVCAAAIKKVGLLDEQYFFSGEIADLCMRIHEAGMDCAIDMGAEAVHGECSSSPLRDTLYLYYNLRNRFLFVKKHHKDMWLQLYCRVAGYCVEDLVLSLLKVKPGRSRAALLALYDGTTGKFGDRNYRFISRPGKRLI